MLHTVILTRDDKTFFEDNGILKYENRGRLRLWLNPISQLYYEDGPIVPERPDVQVRKYKYEHAEGVELPPDSFPDIKEGEYRSFTIFDPEKHMILDKRFHEKAEDLILNELSERIKKEEMIFKLGWNSWTGFIDGKQIFSTHTPDLVVGKITTDVHYDGFTITKDEDSEALKNLFSTIREVTKDLSRDELYDWSNVS